MIQARKSLGQNFLHDKNYLNRIADECIAPGLKLVEIGAGTGNLTKTLLERSDLPLHSIEIDHRMKIFMDCLQGEYPNFSYEIADFFKAKADFEHSTVCGNLPYNVGTMIILNLTKKRPPFMVFLIQSEVANKLAAKPKTHDYSSLSVLVQAYYSVKKLFTIPPKAFTPSPKVMSQVISMTLLERNPNFDKLSELLRLGFSCRRKILSNNLRSLNLEGVDLTRRPEELTVEEWINLL